MTFSFPLEQQIASIRAAILARSFLLTGGLQILLKITNWGFCGRATEKFSD
jgi:hypothetical protein